MKFILLSLALLMTGCAARGDFNNPQIVVRSQYVIRTAPDALKTLPPLPPTINTTNPTNNQVATWINNTEEYVANLEGMIQTLVNFYESPVSAAEAGDMATVTPRATATPNSARVIQPQTTSQGATSTRNTGGAVSNFISRIRGR
jgi:hypothetical protein